jgi:hypothetical protein
MNYNLKKILKINYLFQNKLFNQNIELYTERIWNEFEKNTKKYNYEKNIENLNQYKYLIKKYLLKKHDFNYVNNSINYNNKELENINKDQIKNYIYIENLLNNNNYDEEMIKNNIKNKININIINKNYENDIVIKSIVKEHIIY